MVVDLLFMVGPIVCSGSLVGSCFYVVLSALYSVSIILTRK